MPSRTANDSYSGVAVGVLAHPFQQVEGDERAWTNISSS
jgi:hypothetical protein